MPPPLDPPSLDSSESQAIGSYSFMCITESELRSLPCFLFFKVGPLLNVWCSHYTAGFRKSVRGVPKTAIQHPSNQRMLLNLSLLTMRSLKRVFIFLLFYVFGEATTAISVSARSSYWF